MAFYVLLSLLLCLAISRVIYALYLSPYKNIPGPRLCKITRYWAVYHDIRLNRISKIYEWHRQYGDVVLVAPGEVSFSNAALTKEIYSAAGRHPKSQYFNNFLMYGERPIFCALDVGEHCQMLKRTFAFYQPGSLYKSAVLQPVYANVKKVLGQLKRATEMQPTPTVDVLRYCNFYSFDNITNLVYGPELCAHTINDAACDEERMILEGWKEVEVWNNLYNNFPLVHRIIRTVVSYIRNDPTFLLAEEKLADGNMSKILFGRGDPDKITPGSLLHHLSNAKTPEPLPIPWIAAETLDNVHAAQTTVALALTFALWDLARHPEWQGEIRAELRALGVKEDGLPSFEDILAAPTLDACFRESNRLHPLSSGRAERVVPVTKSYNDVVLPAGTIVSTSTLSIHHKPEVFVIPHEYKPSRWLEADKSTLRTMESCYMPFGYGARLCLGKAFAVAEIKLLIAGVVMEFSLWEDARSPTTDWSMEQLGTQNAMPRGRRCDLGLTHLRKAAAEAGTGED